MRQIEFRGKSKYSDHKWLYGLLVTTASGCVYVVPKNWDGKGLQKYRVIPETVGEYTGYNDCVGNYIYEDDIVDANIDNMDEVSRVVFMYGCWKIQEKYCDLMNSLCYCVEWGRVKVIGNMVDTPEKFDGE